jgi:hypothetical protein
VIRAASKGNWEADVRFSIKTLLATSTIVALGCAGLFVASPGWATAFFSGALGIVLASTVFALVGKWPRRAYWIGFAVFANGCFWLSMYVDGHIEVQPESFEEPRLATTNLLLIAEPYVRNLRQQLGNAQPSSPPGLQFPIGRRMYMSSDQEQDFLRIGNSLFTLLFGLAGGSLGLWYHRRETESSQVVE